MFKERVEISKGQPGDTFDVGGLTFKITAIRVERLQDGELKHVQEEHEQIRYALYNIACAISDLAEALGADETK